MLKTKKREVDGLAIFNFSKENFMLLCILALTGCSGRFPKVELLHRPSGPLCKVAVLPLKDETGNPVVSRMIYRLLISRLIQDTDLEVVEEGAVRSFMIYEHIIPGSPFNLELLKLLRRKTGAQAVIGGRIFNVTKKSGEIRLSIYIWVKDTHTGSMLWSAYHSRTGSEYTKLLHFGRVSTISHLADKMIYEILEKLKKRGFRCRY